jgi:glycosyl transferase family 25
MYEFDNVILPAYVINLKERKDRLKHIHEQFSGKSEFDLHIVEASTGENGAVGLWNSMVKVVEMAIQGEEDVILMCEDDHTFTPFYNRDFLFRNILEANEQGVELLSGGIGGFNHAVPLTANRYWIDSHWCTQFLILYKPIFSKIQAVNFKNTDTADGILSQLTSHKMVLYPFVSVQTDFGYSDITPRNNGERGLIEEYFRKTAARLEKYKKVYDQYLKN